MNRPPGPYDYWFARHQRECGGAYTKVREPEGYAAKKAGRTKKDPAGAPRTGPLDALLRRGGGAAGPSPPVLGKRLGGDTPSTSGSKRVAGVIVLDSESEPEPEPEPEPESASAGVQLPGGSGARLSAGDLFLAALARRLQPPL
jgi:hypothetical protein